MFQNWAFMTHHGQSVWPTNHLFCNMRTSQNWWDKHVQPFKNWCIFPSSLEGFWGCKMNVWPPVDFVSFCADPPTLIYKPQWQKSHCTEPNTQTNHAIVWCNVETQLCSGCKHESVLSSFFCFPRSPSSRFFLLAQREWRRKKWNCSVWTHSLTDSELSQWELHKV